MFNEKPVAENPSSFASPASRDFLPTAINPDAPHWSVAAAIGVWLASVAILFLFAGLAVGLYLAFKGGAAPASAAELMKDSNAIAANLAAIFPAHLLTLAAAWIVVTRFGKQSFWKTLGWNWNGFGFFACLATTVLLYAVAILIGSLMGEQENELTRILQSSRTAVYLTAVMATFTAPLVEEVVYRGVLYPAFRLRFGASAAVVLVTVLFAAIHVPQYLDADKIGLLSSYSTILIIVILSFILTMIRARTGNLLPCFVIHTLFNGVQAALLIAEPYLRSKAPTAAPGLISLLTLLSN